ncbi:MAG: flavodoxin family protein [Candidatus Peribacteraceae bacterium]
MTISIIFASTSGHTQFVVDALKTLWEAKGHTCRLVRAEKSTANDFQDCDLLVLASGTWNTGGQEGNLNPHMHTLLFEKLTTIDMSQKPVALISLGDSRYYFTTRCTEHFMRFLKTANGKPLSPPLIIVNEPYDQEERIATWGQKIIPV